jgi:hypothetical protein
VFPQNPLVSYLKVHPGGSHNRGILKEIERNVVIGDTPFIATRGILVRCAIDHKSDTAAFVLETLECSRRRFVIQ